MFVNVTIYSLDQSIYCVIALYLLHIIVIVIVYKNLIHIFVMEHMSMHEPNKNA